MQKGFVTQVNPVIDHSTRLLCLRPYYNHPKGCPNYNKKEGCPPRVLLFDECFDLSYPVYAIVNLFDFKNHVERMSQKHPNWSEHQLKCVRYWQGTARKQLKELINKFLAEQKGYKANTCPEAMGVNITATLKSAGVELEWPPVNIACQVALAGVEKSIQSIST